MVRVNHLLLCNVQHMYMVRVNQLLLCNVQHMYMVRVNHFFLMRSTSLKGFYRVLRSKLIKKILFHKFETILATIISKISIEKYENNFYEKNSFKYFVKRRSTLLKFISCNCTMISLETIPPEFSII